MNPEKEKEWSCPTCKTQRGMKEQVKMTQANRSDAIHVCENQQCGYPGDILGYFVAEERTRDERPVTLQMLKDLRLPESLINEKELRVGHLVDLIEVKNFAPFLNKAMDLQETWSELIGKLSSLDAEEAKEMSQIEDVELVRFKNMPLQLRKFSRHLLPDVISEDAHYLKKK